MDKKKTKIKQFWDEQAKIFKDSPQSTAPDIYYRGLEIERIISYLKNKGNLLDIGCGNGFSTFKFSENFPNLKIFGVDYSEEMIAQANKTLTKKNKLKGRVSFEVGDVLSISKFPYINYKFDYIVSERCLINLLNWEQQKTALLEMSKLLKPKGKIILCENTQEGLKRLNVLRAQFGLKSIKIRWHNYYMPEKKLLEFGNRHFIVEDVNNIGSLYYILSRVVYAKLCDIEKKEPEYLNPINKIAASLPSLGNYSPNFIFIFRKKYML